MTATSTTPLTFNPLVPPDRDDPFPFYRRSRDEQPLVFAPEIGAWIVTRHADCVAVLAATSCAQPARGDGGAGARG